MLSNRGKYATRALLELALQYEKGPVSIQEIAEGQNIPIKFLEQILLALKHSGFVDSRKGPGGGYFLAKSPETIFLGSVIRAIEGPLALVSCVSVMRHAECGCPHPDDCGLREVWREAREAIAKVLDRTSFADIRDKQLRLRMAQNDAYEFVI